MKKFFVYSIITLIAISCQKYEGEGGTASISGTVYKIRYFRDFFKVYDTLPATAHDVYIVYGDNLYFDDDIETHFDGSFQFDYLHKGEYKIYTYSENPYTADDTTLVYTVNISKRGEEVTIDSIFIKESVRGNSTISGTVMAQDRFDSNNNEKLGYEYTNFYYAADEDVYIQFKNDSSHFDRVQTDYNGTYLFKELVPGTYYIYVYSKHVDEKTFIFTDKHPVFDTVVVNSFNEHIVRKNNNTLLIFD